MEPNHPLQKGHRNVRSQLLGCLHPGDCEGQVIAALKFECVVKDVICNAQKWHCVLCRWVDWYTHCWQPSHLIRSYHKLIALLCNSTHVTNGCLSLFIKKLKYIRAFILHMFILLFVLVWAVKTLLGLVIPVEGDLSNISSTLKKSVYLGKRGCSMYAPRMCW